MPQQRQRQLTLSGNARQSRAQCRRAFVERFQRGIRCRERRAEADRKTGLDGADALDQLVMFECVGAFELHIGVPLRAPETEATYLGPRQRASAKAPVRERRARGGRDRVRDEGHEARRSCAFSNVSTAPSTRLSPR